MTSFTEQASDGRPPFGAPVRSMPVVWALLPLVALIGTYLGGLWLGVANSALVLAALLVAAGVAGAQAIRAGSSFIEIQKRTGQKLADVMPVILILLSIGALIGSWVFSGTIPLLVVVGLELIEPEYLLLTAFVSTSAMSLCTGTSWGSAGTLGVALMGVGAACGVAPAATAGAVVSGAYFGDKLSPLSDSTNIAALAARVDLYVHMRHLLYTVVPGFVVAALVYAVWPMTVAHSASTSNALADELGRRFHGGLSPWVPVLVVLAGVVLKQAPALTICASTVVALLMGVAVQGFAGTLAFQTLLDGFDTSMFEQGPEAPSDLLRRLTERGGLNSMAGTLIYIVAAFLLAAGLELSGALNTLVKQLLARASSIWRLIVATMAAGSTLIALTSHGGVTSLIVGELFREKYEELELAPENLSRTIEDSVTVVEPLMPWTVSALFMATTLGVPTSEYFGWAIFCYGGPLSALFYALTYSRLGVGLKRKSR